MPIAKQLLQLGCSAHTQYAMRLEKEQKEKGEAHKQLTLQREQVLQMETQKRQLNRQKKDLQCEERDLERKESLLFFALFTNNYYYIKIRGFKLAGGRRKSPAALSICAGYFFVFQILLIDNSVSPM